MDYIDELREKLWKEGKILLEGCSYVDYLRQYHFGYEESSIKQ